MRRRLTFLMLLPLLVLGVAAFAQTPPPTPAAKPIDIAGKWNMVLELSIGTSNPVLVLTQDGDKLAGTYTGRYGDAKVAGKIGADRQLAFTVSLEAEGTAVTMYFTGEVATDGQTITKGTCQIEGLGEGNWVAKREKTS